MGRASALAALVVLVLAALLTLRAAHGQADAEQAPRFVAVDVVVDSGPVKLAAYQVAITVTRGDARIVGVEGGAVPAFAEPPYYDPAALHTPAAGEPSRIILGAFSLRHDLPEGKTRVARLMMRVVGPAPVYDAQVMTAGTEQGQKIAATVELKPGVGE